VKRWPTEGSPRALWGGDRDLFYTRDGDKLRERGSDRGKPVDREVKGVHKPAFMARGVWHTCVAEEGGGVACLSNPE
jgi:hypothetical protein